MMSDVANHSLPLVSVITPVYNGAEYISQLIESVLEQQYPNIEHIIIDDGSTDDGATVSILESYQHLRWWSRENRGQYFTMNEGLQAARGEIICFISADDLMMSGAVQYIVDEFLRHPEYDGIYGKVIWINEDGSERDGQELISNAPLWLNFYKQFIVHCSLYLKKNSLIDNSLYFDTSFRYAGDYDWIVRIIKTGLDLGFLNVPLSKIRDHSQRATLRNLDAIDRENQRVHKQYGINDRIVKLVLFVISVVTKIKLFFNS